MIDAPVDRLKRYGRLVSVDHRGCLKLSDRHQSRAVPLLAGVCAGAASRPAATRVARVMRQHGIAGKVRGRRKRTTIAEEAAVPPRPWSTRQQRPDADTEQADRFLRARPLRDGRQWVCRRANGQVLEPAAGTARNLPYNPGKVILTGIELSEQTR